MVKREGGGSRDRNDTVKFIEKGRKNERERGRGGRRISDEKLPMITDAGAETALNDRSRFFCAICTFTSGRAGIGGDAEKRSGLRETPPRAKLPFAIAAVLRIVP